MSFASSFVGDSKVVQADRYFVMFNTVNLFGDFKCADGKGLRLPVFSKNA